MAITVAYYGKFNQQSISCRHLLDACGKELKRIKKEDMQDVSVARWK